MTDARRKAKILLLQQRKTFAQLAEESGLAEATVHNVLDGRSASRRSKQAITNALGAEIWDDVPVTQRVLVFDPNVEVESPTLEAAIKFARQFPAGTVRRVRKTVYFMRPIGVTIKRHD